MLWSAEIENDIYNAVVSGFAPYLPLSRSKPPRPAKTVAEIEGICDNWIWTAGRGALAHRTRVNLSAGDRCG